MKAFFALSIYVILLFTSCGGNKEAAFAIKQNLISANSAKVIFSSGKTVNIESGKDELRILKNSIGEQHFDEKECGADGKIEFYSQNMLTETVDFSLKQGCSFVHFMYKAEPQKKSISAEALKYLSEISK